MGPWAVEKVEEPVEKPPEESKVEKEKPIDTSATENEAQENAVPEEKEDALMHIAEPDEEEEKWEKVNERKINRALPPRPGRGSTISEAKTTFHGHELVDYQGRSWTVPPSGIRAEKGM